MRDRVLRTDHAQRCKDMALGARTQAPGERRDRHGALFRGKVTPTGPHRSPDLSQDLSQTSARVFPCDRVQANGPGHE